MTVVVLGRPALTCELLSRALNGSEVAAETEDVVVLVDPAPSEWSRASGLSARIVVLDRDSSEETTAKMVLAGAEAIVDPETSLDGLREVVRLVASGGTLLTPRQARIVAEGARARRRRSRLHCI